MNQHYSFSFNIWSKALELDLYGWRDVKSRSPTFFDVFQLDQLRTRTGPRVGVASLPSQMCGISELHVTPSGCSLTSWAVLDPGPHRPRGCCSEVGGRHQRQGGPLSKKDCSFFWYWGVMGSAGCCCWSAFTNEYLSLSLYIYIYYITLYVHAYALYDADGLLLEKLWKRGVQEWRPYRCRRPGRYLQCNQARPPTYGLHFSNRGCMLCTCQVRFSWSLKRSTFWMLQVDCRWLMMIVDCKVFFYYMNSLRLDQLNGPPFFLHHAWIHNQCSFSGCSPLSPSSLRPLSQCTAFVNSVHTMYLDVFRNLLALWTPF